MDLLRFFFVAYRRQGPCSVDPVICQLNMDTQDAQDKQDERLLLRKLRSRETRHWIPAIGGIRGSRDDNPVHPVHGHVKNFFALGTETKRRNLKGVTSCPLVRFLFPLPVFFAALRRPSCAFVDNSFHSVACGAKQGRSGQASSKETSQCDILTPTGSRDTVGSVLGQGKGSHGSG